MQELIQEILDNPAASMVIVANLILIESLLSVDNAAVLATMVMDLPEKQRGRALKYGIWGAYIFRGLAMIFASLLIQIWWLKPIGGIYLLWLVVGQYKDHFGYGERGSILFRIISLAGLVIYIGNDQSINALGIWILRIASGLYLIYLLYSLFKLQEDKDDDGEINKSNNRVYKFFVNRMSPFWSTVILVEIMDMAFSIDNVFAAVAFTDNMILVCTGVFIGILAMRFIAQWFVRLMERYSFLEAAAFIVIAILGLKLTLSLIEHKYPKIPLSTFLKSEVAEVGITLLTVAIFFIPILTSLLFNYPRKSVTK